jgi:hypothetical protein
MAPNTIIGEPAVETDTRNPIFLGASPPGLEPACDTASGNRGCDKGPAVKSALAPEPGCVVPPTQLATAEDCGAFLRALPNGAAVLQTMDPSTMALNPTTGVDLASVATQLKLWVRTAEEQLHSRQHSPVSQGGQGAKAHHADASVH